MKHTLKLLMVTVLFGALLVLMGGGTPVAAQGPISYFPNYTIPTGIPDDARMVCVSGTNLATFAGQTVEIGIVAPAGATSFGFDIFNGNSNGLWSIGAPDTIFDLRADPSGVGSGPFIPVVTWRGNSANTPVPGVWTGPTNMVNNGWWNATVYTSPAAQGPNGNYFYRLLVSLPNPNASVSSCFKFRSTAIIYLPPETIWGIMGAIGGNATAALKIIFPGYQTPLTDPMFFVNAMNNGQTTYDGRWTFYFNVPLGQTSLDLWDGDFDYGTNPAQPNGVPSGVPIQQCTPTRPPNAPPYPPFIPDSMKDINGGPVKAFNSAGTYPGSPPDDAHIDAYRRSPCVYWKVTSPTGQVYTNTSPSGNSEWDLTTISAPPGTFLPAGIWRLDVVGLDLSNISFFRFPSQVVGNCGTSESPAACPIPPLFGSIGDTVWKDTNANGVQDSGETGIAGVTVNLLNSNGAVIATTTTDANGKYLFSNVAAGSYRVQFVAPSGYVYSPQYQGGNPATDSNANTNTGLSDVINLSVGANDMTIDAGLYQLATLGDFVWHDLNANGVQDAGEPGIAGVTVNLLDASGNPIPGKTTTTDANGKYSFTNLVPGTYAVQFVLPAGYAFSPQDQGGDDAKDSDANSTTGKTASVTLVAGANNTTLDAGIYKLASLGDYVWEDKNGNGVQDSGEPGIAGVTVKLLGSDGTTVLATTTTDANGYYKFSNLKPGVYSVEFVKPAGYAFTGQDLGGNDAKDSDANPTTGKTVAITLTSGQYNDTLDAGLYKPASLGNFVWIDWNANGIQDASEVNDGLNGVTVKLLDSGGNLVATKTTADLAGKPGYYLFNNLKPATYSVQFVAPSGYVFTSANVGTDDAKDSDAGVSDGKTTSVTLQSGESNLTVDAGLYKLASCGSNLCAYIRTPGFWKNYANHMSNATFLNLIQHTRDFSYLSIDQAVKILSTNSGTTSGLTGAAAILNGTDARLLKFLLTAEINAIWNGQDKAAGLGGQLGTGIYQGTSQTVNQLLSTAYATLLSTKTLPSNMEAYVVYLGGEGEGQSVSACKVQPPPPCVAPTPPPTPATASIGDWVWEDKNGNGIQDSGEPGIDGVTVKLLDSTGNTVLKTTTTAGGGKYAFTNLTPGTYQVQFVLPTGYTFAKSKQGTDTLKDSNADQTTGKTGAITLAAGQTDNSWDAGLVRTTSPSKPNVTFDEKDKAVCQLTPTTYTITGIVSLPSTITQARLQLTYRIVEPKDLATPEQYIDYGLVSNGTKFSYQVQWPGVRPTDTVVEIHMGAMLLDAKTGNPIMSQGASLDYYWYPWVCPAPTPTPKPTLTPTSQPTFTSTPKPTLTPTSQPTLTPTSQPTFTSTPKPTLTPTSQPTLTPTTSVNYCGYIRTPGFWKNYSNHMSDATFLTLLKATQNFGNLTVADAVAILSQNSGTSTVEPFKTENIDATFLKFLLAAQINAAWNGNDKAAAVGGQLGIATYQGTGKTVNQLLAQAYANRKNFTADENAWMLYLGGGGENQSASACLVK